MTSVFKYLNENKVKFTTDLTRFFEYIDLEKNPKQIYPSKEVCASFCTDVIYFLQDMKNVDHYIKMVEDARTFIRGLSFKDEMKYMTCCHKWSTFKERGFDIGKLVEEIGENPSDKNKFMIRFAISLKCRKYCKNAKTNDINMFTYMNDIKCHIKDTMF